KQSKDKNGNPRVAKAHASPVKRHKHKGKELYGNGKRQCHGGNGTPTPQQCGNRSHQQQSAENINVAASRYFNRQKWVPGKGQHPVFSFAYAPQQVEQHKNNGEVTKHKCYFESKDRLVNRSHTAEEKLRPGWIRSRKIGVVQCARLRGVQAGGLGIVGNKRIWIVAEPLHPSIPNVSVDVIVSTGRLQ